MSRAGVHNSIWIYGVSSQGPVQEKSVSVRRKLSCHGVVGARFMEWPPKRCEMEVKECLVIIATESPQSADQLDIKRPDLSVYVNAAPLHSPPPLMTWFGQVSALIHP